MQVYKKGIYNSGKGCWLLSFGRVVPSPVRLLFKTRGSGRDSHVQSPPSVTPPPGGSPTLKRSLPPIPAHVWDAGGHKKGAGFIPLRLGTTAREGDVPPVLLGGQAAEVTSTILSLSTAFLCASF